MAKKISSPRVIGKGVFWNPRFQTNCRVIYIYIYISDKSHSWLANSSPLEVSGMRTIIDRHFKTIRRSIISFWVLKPSPSESLWISIQEWWSKFCSSPKLKNTIFRGILGGLFGALGSWNHHYQNRYEILHKNGGLTFALVQSWKIPFWGAPRGHFGGFSWGLGKMKPSPSESLWNSTQECRFNFCSSPKLENPILGGTKGAFWGV